MNNEELISLLQDNNGDVPLFYQVMAPRKREIINNAPLFTYVKKYDGEIMIHKEFYKPISRIFLPPKQ